MVAGVQAGNVFVNLKNFVGNEMSVDFQNFVDNDIVVDFVMDFVLNG